jgi:small-conductance mechanosensitive channel
MGLLRKVAAMSLFRTGPGKRCRIWLGLGALGFCLAFAGPIRAQEAAPEPAQSQEVQQLLKLLQDPKVQDWLQNQQSGPEVVAEPPPVETSVGGLVADRIAAVRGHLASLIAAAPTIGRDLDRARIIFELEFEERGLVQIGLLLLAFIGAGFGAELIFWFATAGIRRWVIAMPVPTAIARLKATAYRFCFGLAWVTSFALGSVGAFLIFDWPLLLREIVLGYLVAFLALRLALVVGRLLLAPGAEKFRVVPMSSDAALFWHRRVAIVVGFYSFARVTLGILKTLGVSLPCIQIMAYALGLFLLAMGLEAVWRREVGAPVAGQAETARRIGNKAWNWLLSALFVVIWLTWAGQMVALFWLSVVAIALPLAQWITRRSIGHLLRPGDEELPGTQAPVFVVISLERGMRVVFIVVAALLLAHAWHIDLIGLTAGDSVGTLLLRGAINAVVIILVANFIWHVAKGVIDAKVNASADTRAADDETTRRRARVRTLLPILANVLFIVVLAVAAMMVLSSLGVEIGPLIAGAGVVGVAVGFGAQTLVKDIISGVFYLLDDAFRVGEYIQSGSYKGTVESFSLRSVKLRHHRGPLFTVPFGELGAVQNLSRDWVIDKNTIGVEYDTDLNLAKKLIKQVGKELQADPEFGPHILEPLKMQGVEQFGEYAIQLRMKMMTRPGEQFPIRRKAFAMIKQAFDANGIKFAFPTVQVSGGEESATAAAARQLHARENAAAADAAPA